MASDGIPAALPLAAAATLLLARWLPVHFEYRADSLGIVSPASVARYPLQQETFWLAFAMGVGGLLVWLLARALRTRGSGTPWLVAVEALAAASLAVLLGLPLSLAAPLAMACGAAALVSAARARTTAADPTPVAAEQRGPRRGRSGLWVAAIAVLAVGLNPTFFVSLWSVANGLPDERRVVEGFVFQGEMGQHLAWANALLHGGFHGKDFFCLYGPLYDLGTVASWKLLGRSISAWDLYFASGRVAAMGILLAFAACLLRRRGFLLLVPLLVPWSNLRIALGLLGLLILGGWLRDGRLWRASLAGFVAGVSLLYSQEFGLVFALTAALAFALHGAGRAALAFAGAAALAVMPLLLWYAANDAALPMLRMVVSYPGYMLAGYAKVPFPSLAASVPLDWTQRFSQEFQVLRMGYAAAAIGLGGLLLALPISAIDPRRPVRSARELLTALRRDPQRTLLVLTAIYGLLAFRSALGRSDVVHVLAVLPVPALLLAVAADRLYAAARSDAARRPVSALRAALLALLVACAGLAGAARPLQTLWQSTRNAATLATRGHHPRGVPYVTSVARWIQRHTETSDSVLFLPNNGAYYYLSDRPSPIRFVMGHQIATQAHRDEVLRDLQRQPPRYVVWDHDAARVDGLPDELVFGPPLLDWLDANYEPQVSFGPVEIRRPRTTPEP